MAIKLHNTLAVYPGPWLRRNIVEPYGLNISKAAEHLQVSRVALSNVVNGKAALSPDMALRFEQAFGISAAQRCCGCRRRMTSRWRRQRPKPIRSSGSKKRHEHGHSCFAENNLLSPDSPHRARQCR
jgi:antitoxin HigA-1